MPEALTNDEEALLTRKEKLLRIMASERARDYPNLWEDALQEGRITLLEVSRTHPDKSEAYWHSAVRLRMGEVVARGNWTGRTGRRGWGDAFNAKGRMSLNASVSKDGEGPELGDVLVLPESETAARFNQIEIDHHNRDVSEALARLSPRHRAYVIQRFWEEKSHLSISLAMGISEGRLQREWETVILPSLRENLADMESLIRST